jgi:hypothetical protein
MGTQKTLKKDYIVKDNGVVITETVEKNLSKEELGAEKLSYLSRQTNITRQIDELQRQHSELSKAIIDLDAMIAAIG